MADDKPAHEPTRRERCLICARQGCIEIMTTPEKPAPLVPIEWPAWSLSDEAKAQLAEIDRHTWGPFRGR